MNTDLEITKHFVRAFYYYSTGNSIWHIYFKKVKNFVEDWHFRKLMNDFAVTENFDPLVCKNTDGKQFPYSKITKWYVG
jgi:hypothetical protein